MRLRRCLLIVWAILLPVLVFINLRSWTDAETTPNTNGAPHGYPQLLANLPIASPEEPLGPDVLLDTRMPQCAMGARPDAEPLCGGRQCCWEIRNRRLRAVFTSSPLLQWHSLHDISDGSNVRSLPVAHSPLLQLFPAHNSTRPGGRPAAVGPGGCRMLAAEQANALQLRFKIRCNHTVSGIFSAMLADDDAHYVRYNVSLWSDASEGGTWPDGGFATLRLFTILEEVEVQETRSFDKEQTFYETLDGLPLVVNDQFFAGIEHPLAVYGAAEINGTRWWGTAGQIAHLAGFPTPTRQKPWEYGVVLGAISEPSQARRDFVSYLHRERPGRRSPMVHYNSWYDFYSYQDEGYNGGFKDPFPNETKISALRLDAMNETGSLRRIEDFGRELVRKRGAQLDSFLWDDGWDDTGTLWQFDSQRFPRRFDVMSAKAQSFGAGTGVWLSPWGGYGFPQEARVKYGKAHGWETNFNSRTSSEAFSLAGPNYRKAFTEVALKMQREQGVNMFKFDGVAGDPHELAVEMDAMLGLISDLRAGSPHDGRCRTQRGAAPAAPMAVDPAGLGQGRAQQGREGASGKRRCDDDIWINLTTGTWASPFFLLWADSIWRGGPDIPTRAKDWLPDGIGRLPSFRSRSDGLSRRQRWIRWRSTIVYVLVARRSNFFPISQLMIHGVILASHGDALHWGLDSFDLIDFAQEVWSFVALGLQLQELYIDPRGMTPEAWDILAEGLTWARREAHVLRDSHWAFGDPTDRDVYATAAWSVAEGRGVVLLHNPTGSAKRTEAFSLADALELPLAQRALRLRVEVVRSDFRKEAGPGGARLVGWDCAELLPHGSEADRLCSQRAEESVRIRMFPTEVLVLAVSIPGYLDGSAAPAAAFNDKHADVEAGSKSASPPRPARGL